MQTAWLDLTGTVTNELQESWDRSSFFTATMNIFAGRLMSQFSLKCTISFWKYSSSYISLRWTTLWDCVEVVSRPCDVQVPLNGTFFARILISKLPLKYIISFIIYTLSEIITNWNTLWNCVEGALRPCAIQVQLSCITLLVPGVLFWFAIT